MATALATHVNGGNGHADRFQRLKAEIHRQVVEMIDVSKLGRLSSDRLRTEVRGVATQLIHSQRERLNDIDRDRMIEEIMHEAFGLGPLEHLMGDPTISDI